LTRLACCSAADSNAGLAGVEWEMRAESRMSTIEMDSSDSFLGILTVFPSYMEGFMHRSLGILLVLVFLFLAGSGWSAEANREQAKAIAAIKKLGGNVTHNFSSAIRFGRDPNYGFRPETP